MLRKPEESLKNWGREHIPVGLRYIEPEEFEGINKDKVHFWKMEELTNLHADVFSEMLFREIKNQKINKMYVSIDIDVLDASIALYRSARTWWYEYPISHRYHPESGNFIEKEHNMDLVALDLVEVAPDWDIGNITALAAVKLSLKHSELILFPKKRKRNNRPVKLKRVVSRRIQQFKIIFPLETGGLFRKRDIYIDARSHLKPAVVVSRGII